MIIAVDPGKTTGIALYASTAAPIVASWVDPSSAEIHAFLRWAKESGFKVLVLEDQHIPRPRIAWRMGKPWIDWKLNWPNLLVLIRGAARWMTCAELVGMRVEFIKPAEWQGPMLGKSSGLSTKQLCSRVVGETWSTVRRWKPKKGELPTDAKPVKTSALNEHIRDAMMMGRWWVLHGGRR